AYARGGAFVAVGWSAVVFRVWICAFRVAFCLDLLLAFFSNVRRPAARTPAGGLAFGLGFELEGFEGIEARTVNRSVDEVFKDLHVFLRASVCLGDDGYDGRLALQS